MSFAYAQFTKERFAAVKAAHPEAKGIGNIAKYIGAEWKALPPSAKNAYKNKIVRKTRKANSPPKSPARSSSSSSSSAAAVVATSAGPSSAGASTGASTGPSYFDEDLLAPVGFNRVSPKKNSPRKNSPTKKAKRKPNKYAEYVRNEGARIRRNNPEMAQIDVVKEVGKRWQAQKGSA